MHLLSRQEWQNGRDDQTILAGRGNADFTMCAVGGFLRPVRKLKIQKIRARREWQSALVAKHLVLDALQGFLVDRIRERLLLSENSLVFGRKYDHANFN